MPTRLVTSKVRFRGGDADCSSLVKRILAALWLVSDDTWMWTGNERPILASAGFERRNKWAPVRGDVLWRDGHTEVYLGGGICGGARIDEVGGVTGPRAGDQTGREVASGPYDPDRWEECWRYCGDEDVDGIPIAECVAQLMEHAIEHATHGYSQVNREGDGTWEDVTLHWYVDEPATNGETMDCIISIKGRNTLVWFDGTNVNDLTSTKDVDVLDVIARACYGTSLPRVTLTEEQFARLCQSIRGGYPKHLRSLVEKYAPRSPEE